MPSTILDSHALLALLREEPGGDKVRAVLEKGGIDVKSMRRIDPSLENVFISLLTHSNE